MDLVTTTKGFLFEPTKEPHTDAGMLMFVIYISDHYDTVIFTSSKVPA